ncbi:MAG: hypothetical protein IKH67_06580 [Lachnospiraceae bacterium]|nr:hypothetical protein [Lachnospiraceae bacterium]
MSSTNPVFADWDIQFAAHSAKKLINHVVGYTSILGIAADLLLVSTFALLADQFLVNVDGSQFEINIFPS